jgi:BlaI family transcriptional regulator, penicillinase repressor
MAKTPSHHDLSRRERQIMDVIYRLERAAVADVLERLPDPPSYSAVRAMMRILEEKGHLRHEQEGPRYLYSPTVPRDTAKESALKNVLRTFFGGSTEAAVAALLDLKGEEMTDGELERISQVIEDAKKREEG